MSRLGIAVRSVARLTGKIRRSIDRDLLRVRPVSLVCIHGGYSRASGRSICTTTVSQQESREKLRTVVERVVPCSMVFVL